MDEELIIVENLEENHDEAIVTDIEVTVEQDETVEYIETAEIEPIEVEMTEQIGWTTNGDGSVTHDSLVDRNEPGQHLMSAITGLEETLHKLSSISENNTKYSTHTGIAEFRQWLKDGNYKTGDYKDSGGVGFFVSLVRDQSATEGGNIRIDISSNEEDGITDVYGVTVINSAFCGNQSEKYDLLYPETVEVIDTPISEDLSDNPNYAKVCLLGNVQVRTITNSNIQIGDYVVPSANGFAKKSENNVGFKVVNIGTKTFGDDTYAWSYVEIALVPQNDNIARVLKELESSQVNLNNVVLQLGDTINGVGVNVGTLSGKVDGFQDIINESQVVISNQNVAIQKVQTEVDDINTKADTAMNTTATLYTEAVKTAQDAKKTVDDVLGDVGKLQANMDVIAQWSEDETNPNADQRIVGFVARANQDSETLAGLTAAFGENGSDLTTIIQKIDENGAAIQHLVTHVDKYTLGAHSPANGLSADETSIIQPGTIYVPTETHDETSYVEKNKNYTDNSFTFTYGTSYIWKASEPAGYMWAEYKSVSTQSEYVPGVADEDLWYCWQGIEDGNDKILYNPGTLYCWDEDAQKWIIVAAANDNMSRAIGLIEQTAEKLTSQYTDLEGNLSVVSQKVDEISTTVKDEVEGQISQIHQTAQDIMMGVYDPKQGSTSLGLLLDGMTSTSVNAEPVLVKTVVIETLPTNIVRYADAPMWSGTEFVFAGEPSEDGEYYFDIDEEGNVINSYYCHIINGGYEVYGINNVAMASINTKVSDVASEVESWTRFQKGQEETMTSIGQVSNETGAGISSMVYGDFRDCVEIKLELTDEEKNSISSKTKYAKQPTYNLTTKEFSFEGIAKGDDYCIGNDNNKCYYKLLYDINKILIGYEKYEMKSSPYASIVQKVDSNGNSSIGLVSGNEDAIGSLFVNTINDKSEVLIDADKIGVNGTAVFQDRLGTGTTSISGDYIRTGVLASANYIGPVTYKKYGAKIEGSKLIASENVSDCVWYAIVLQGETYELLPSGTYYKCNEIKEDIDLTELDITSLLEAATASFYIVCNQDFDLIPNAEVIGTKFDLNNGTIYSSNFSLDRDGDLSITGKITATSGYIGNSVNGFTIGREAPIYQYDVQNTLTVGDYVFYYENKGYAFHLDEALYTGSKITVNFDAPSIIIDGVTTNILETIPTNATRLIGEDISAYYLSYNNQNTLWGNRTRKTPGVYVGPRGIGLGDGAFGINSDGDLETMGNITIYKPKTDEEGDITYSPIFQVNDQGLTMDGNISLSGSVTLGGSITWSESANPTQVLYAVAPTTKPKDGTLWSSYSSISSDDTEWHRTYTEGDLFASYTYNGGQTWTQAVRFVGEKGDTGPQGDTGASGAPGSNDVDASYIFSILTNNGANQGVFPFYRNSDYNNETTDTQLFINAEYIQTGTLNSINIKGSNFYAIDNSSYLTMNSQSFNVYDNAGYNKFKIGWQEQRYDLENGSSATYTLPYITIGAGTSASEGTDQGLIKKFPTGLWIGDSDCFNMTYRTGTGIFIDFTNNQIYKYIDGTQTEIGSGGSSGTVEAVFG